MEEPRCYYPRQRYFVRDQLISELMNLKEEQDISQEYINAINKIMAQITKDFSATTIQKYIRGWITRHNSNFA